MWRNARPPSHALSGRSSTETDVGPNGKYWDGQGSQYWRDRYKGLLDITSNIRHNKKPLPRQTLVSKGALHFDGNGEVSGCEQHGICEGIRYIPGKCIRESDRSGASVTSSPMMAGTIISHDAGLPHRPRWRQPHHIGCAGLTQRYRIAVYRWGRKTL